MSDGLLPDDNWAYSDGQRDGAENEREAIVAWLHKQEGIQTFGDLARAVERGEHLRGDDE